MLNREALSNTLELSENSIKIIFIHKTNWIVFFRYNKISKKQFFLNPHWNQWREFMFSKYEYNQLKTRLVKRVLSSLIMYVISRNY